MQLFRMFQQRRYLLIAIGISVVVFVLYPAIQVFPRVFYNYFFWFSLLTPVRWVLYVSYGVLFGVTLSFFLYTRRTKTCAVSRQVRSGFSGVLGAFLGLVVPACPACLSLASLFLPVSAFSFIVARSAQLLGLSILLLLVSLWVLGAFKRGQAF